MINVLIKKLKKIKKNGNTKSRYKKIHYQLLVLIFLAKLGKILIIILIIIVIKRKIF